MNNFKETLWLHVRLGDWPGQVAPLIAAALRAGENRRAPPNKRCFAGGSKLNATKEAPAIRDGAAPTSKKEMTAGPSLHQGLTKPSLLHFTLHLAG